MRSISVFSGICLWIHAVGSVLFTHSVCGGHAAFEGRPGESIYSTQRPAAPEVDLFTGRGVSLGGVFFPHFHASGALGGTTAGSFETLAFGHHDPQTTGTLLALEPGLSLRAGEVLHGFATYSAATDAEHHLEGKWEEAFLKLPSLPAGFELRAGRFLNRFGFQNAVHSHGWDFVNQNLLNGRVLHEGELITDGSEITWNLPTPFRSALSFSYGVAPAHEEDEHGHVHGGEEPAFEADGARFDDDFFGFHWIGRFDYNDFHQHRTTVSAAWGENLFGRTTQIYGAGYEYLWRENGYEPGGGYFRWHQEIAYRRFGAEADEPHDHEDEDHVEEPHDSRAIQRDEFDDLAVSSVLAYGFNEHMEAGLRIEWVSGIHEAGLDERWRLSPNLTFFLNAERTFYLRCQYDYDHSSEFGSEHSGMVQLGFNWGGAEVR